MKTCERDPLRASILRKCLDVLLPFNTKIVILSLEQGVVPDNMKKALLRPLFKHLSLDHELFPNYMSISNLMFISKLCVRVVASQVDKVTS